VEGSHVITIPSRIVILLLIAALPAIPFSIVEGSAAMKWEKRIEVASGKAYRGPWEMNESKWYFVDDPTVAVTERGDAGVAWADHARKDIFFQVFGPEGKPRFSEPVNVTRNPKTFSWLPRMAMTSGNPGEVYILWQEIIFSGGTHGGEILFALSTDGGRSFTEPINLSNSIAGDGKGRLTREIWYNGSLDLARSTAGNLYAAWTAYEGALYFSRSVNRGKSFSDPLPIAGDRGDPPARGPSLAVYREDTVLLAWTVGEERDADIHFTASRDAGRTFEEPQVLARTIGHSEAPKIRADREGAVHLVFGESPQGPLEKYHVLYTRGDGGGSGFEEPREISSPHFKEFDSVNFPHLDLDESGNLYVLWELFPKRIAQPQGLGFTFSQDTGSTFAPPEVVPGTLDPELGFSGSQQGLYMKKLAVNGKGDVAIVNSTFRPNRSSHIWLIRGRITGR
jgi:hypothetical protein